MTVAQVCVDLPLPHLDRPFDYLVPAADAETARGELGDPADLRRQRQAHDQAGALAGHAPLAHAVAQRRDAVDDAHQEKQCSAPG